MTNNIDNKLISDKFRNSPHYPAFLEAAKNYVNLNWEKSIKSNPIAAVNLAALGAFFAWEFGINADECARHISKIQSEHHPRNATVYRDILAFVITERATKNIKGDEYGISAHVHPALDAAETTGANVSILRDFISGNHRGSYIKLPRSIRSFAKESLSSTSYLNNSDTCLGVIGLSRELLLDQVFKRIASALPNDPKFDDYKHFLLAHVEIDGNDHGPKMARILDEVIVDVDKAVLAAKEFLERRTRVYKEVLATKEPLFETGRTR